MVALLASVLFVLLMWWHPPRDVTATSRSQVQGLLRVGMTSVVTATLLLAPGLVLRARVIRWRGAGLGWLPLPGLGVLVVIGGLAWWQAPASTSVWLSRIGVLAVLAALAVWCRGRTPGLDSGEVRALGVTTCVFAAALGRSLWSPGPDGELYAGTISRTLEVGDRPDSRISYHVVSVMTNGLDPSAGAGAKLFAPYAFLDRGPLPGLATTPIALLTGTRPTAGFPDQPWSVFDLQGFMVYRITLMLLGVLCLLAVHTLTRSLGGAGRAELAVVIVGGAPFVVHEVWFTWPKLAAAAMVLLAATAVLRRRDAPTGMLAGLGYLFHPLALLAVPTLALLVAVRGRVESVATRARGRAVGTGTLGWVAQTVRAGVLMAVGLAVVAGGWRLLNHKHHGSGGFTSYFTEADTHPDPSVGEWLVSRGHSLGNTLVPFFVFRDPDDASVNSIYAPSDWVVHLFFQYWTGLAFGAGIVFYPVLLWGLARAARRYTLPFLATVVVPLVLFCVYWGSYDSGLLREGLHPWVLTVLVVWTLAWPRLGTGESLPRWLRWLLVLRLVEVALDAAFPSAWFHGSLTTDGHGTGDVAALALLAGALIGLAVLTLRITSGPVLRPALDVADDARLTTNDTCSSPAIPLDCRG